MEAIVEQYERSPEANQLKILKKLEDLCGELEYEVDTNDPQYRRWRLPQQVALSI